MKKHLIRQEQLFSAHIVVEVLELMTLMPNIGVASSVKNIIESNNVSTYIGGDVLTEQERFIAGETSVMVATKAFGMGIDKPNVRFTYNICFSGSLEAFVQEAGRAGRDRKMALSTILYSSKQFMEQKSTNSNYGGNSC
ncbi:MAG: hypothetical protein LKM34_07780 [Prevotella sp.]|jgi:ATP-dependent DNA helicase RecQ|nr:hypothetical protein [Prevotella sp.]